MSGVEVSAVIVEKEEDKSPPSCTPCYLLTTCGLQQVNTVQAAKEAV